MLLSSRQARYMSHTAAPGDGGWIDNAHGVTEASTQQQEEAARYFDYLVEKYGWTEEDHIILTRTLQGRKQIAVCDPYG